MGLGFLWLAAVIGFKTFGAVYPYEGLGLAGLRVCDPMLLSRSRQSSQMMSPTHGSVHRMRKSRPTPS